MQLNLKSGTVVCSAGCPHDRGKAAVMKCLDFQVETHLNRLVDHTSSALLLESLWRARSRLAITALV